jgi:diguanylate cyclase (GGDEF)-like protein
MTAAASSAPLDWHLWLAQILITILFAAGFSNYYGRAWHLAVHDQLHWRQYFLRALLALACCGIGIELHMIGWRVFTNATGLMFHNLGLFVLTITLVDKRNSLFEFAVKVVATLSIWWMHHEDYYSRPQFSISLLLLTAAVVALWLFRDQIRNRALRQIGMYSYIGLAFWLFLPPRSAGLIITPMIQLQGFSMYFAATLLVALVMQYDYGQLLVNEENAQAAHFDTLTNARSYTTYREDITKMFQEAENAGTPLALAVIDIDHFKQINDHYGHLVGDSLLGAVAKLMQKTVRAYPGENELYRTGGEEFVIAFPGLTALEAEPILSDCWADVRSGPIRAEQFSIPVTVSIGVDQYQLGDESSDDIYTRSDASLYQSKRGGRDTITIMGKTQEVRINRPLYATRTLFSQHLMNMQKFPPVSTHEEVQVARYEYDHDRWNFPRAFVLPVQVQLNYVHDLLQAHKTTRIMIQLTLEQFRSPDTLERLVSFKAMEPQLAVLVVELAELPSLTELADLGPRYRQFDIRIALVEIDPRRSVDELASTFPYIDALKYRIADIRHAFTDDQARVQTAAWYAAIGDYDINLVICGVENSIDAAYARDVIKAKYQQGYYYDRPNLPRLA